MEELAARLAATRPSLGASTRVPAERRWRGDAAGMTSMETNADADAMLVVTSRTFAITI
jgi:hypothetical protein